MNQGSIQSKEELVLSTNNPLLKFTEDCLFTDDSVPIIYIIYCQYLFLVFKLFNQNPDLRLRPLINFHKETYFTFFTLNRNS